MGYTPNTNARALVTKKAWLIGLLFSEDVGSGIAHPHFSTILQSFITKAQGYGYDVVFVNTMLRQKEASYLEHCRYRGVDGVLLAAGRHFTSHIQSLLESNFPCVSVEDIYPNAYTVITDNYTGTMQALEYLYFLGHRKIAHLCGPSTSLAGMERLEAYKAFLTQKGLPYNPKYVVESAYYSREAGVEASNLLLQQCWDDIPTAIFASYDELACALKTVLQQRGYRIPLDISVVGFDDLAVAETAGITTVRQDRPAIGEQAADLLVKLIEGDKVEGGRIMRLPTRLIVRESAARIEVQGD